MKRWLAIACVVATSAAAADDMVLKPDVLGPVAIGSSLSQMERILRQKIPYDQTQDACQVVSGRATESLGVSYLMESRKVTRINVDYFGSADGSPIRTAAGIGLGSTEEDVMKAYAGRVRVVPNSGDPSWHYLYVDEPDHQSGLGFSTDGKKVKSMYAGVYPALAYKEGCNP